MSNIGIDLGRTIVQSDPKVIGSHFKDKRPFDRAFEVIKKLAKAGNIIYIVSKVDSQQKEAAHNWFAHINFFNEAGVNKDNVYFCFERRDKAFFAKGLGLSVFIDDRPEVLMAMESSVKKILFNPYPPDVEKHKAAIEGQGMIVVKDWTEIESLLLK